MEVASPASDRNTGSGRHPNIPSLERAAQATATNLEPEEYASLRLDILTLVRFAVPEPLFQNGDKLHLEEFTMSPKECLTRELEEYGQEREARGRAQGQRSLLTNLLRLKFGPLSAASQARVARATPEQLETWAARVLTAATLADVFGESGTGV